MSDMSDTPSLPAGHLDFTKLVDQVTSQPELFEADGQPVDYQTLEAAKTVSGASLFAFSGRTTTRHEAKAMAIAILRLAGESKRRIAERVGCSRNVIDKVMERLEAAGKIEPLKERLPRLLGSLAEDAAERARELIDTGVVSAEHAAYLKALGIVAGVGADKVLAAAAGQVAGDLHLHMHQHTHLEGDARAWMRQRRAALSADSAAADSSPKSLNSSAAIDVAAADASPTAPQAPSSGPSGAAPSTASDPDQDPDQDPGGGGSSPAAGQP